MQSSLEEPNFFHPIDSLFAERIFPAGSPDALLFLAYVLKSAREGNLCVALSHDLDPHLAKGATELPPELFEEYLVRQENRFYLRRNWECEQNLLMHLKRLKDQRPSIPLSLEGLEKEPLYPNHLKNWDFGCAKAPGLIDRKRPHISNIGSFTIDQSRELSRQPKSNSSGGLGINAEQKGALVKAATQTLTLISGGPGTGKTYIASVFVRLFLNQGARSSWRRRLEKPPRICAPL